MLEFTQLHDIFMHIHEENKERNTKLVIKYENEIIGTIETNHGMTVWEALDLLGIDMDQYAAYQGWDGWDADHLSMAVE